MKNRFVKGGADRATGEAAASARLLRLAMATAFGLTATTGVAEAQSKVQNTDIAGATLAVQPSAARQMEVLQQIKTSKTPVQDKIESSLYMAMLKERRDARLAALPDYEYLSAGKDGRIAVDITLVRGDGAKAVFEKLASLDGVLLSAKPLAVTYRTMRAKVRLSDLETLAKMPQVNLVREAVGAFTNALNVSQGDAAHGANLARGAYGANGAGVKICALSDGVTSLATAIASGDLPAVDVLPGQAGSGDEGTAMLEIIHDLAPSASLGFASAFNGEASFAQNIRDLATSGCKVITDDVKYFDEGVFQDGPVAQAVNDVTAAGVLYFSSAGNSGNLTDGTSGTWEGDFKASTLPNPAPLATAGALHDFGDGGQSVAITASSTSGATLIWAENYDLAGGTASTDYDLYVMNSGLTSILASSTTRQDGVGGNDIPYERVTGITAGRRIVIARFAVGTTSTAPAIHLSTLRGRINPALATAFETSGHNSTAAGFGMAATPAGPAVFNAVPPVGPFPNQFTSVNASESFSSDGPRRILLSPTGAELTPGNRTITGGVVRQKPDLTAADGVSTSAPGFNPFFGTSAAAPHAAAIAGLVQSGQPSLTPAQVRAALTGTAIDIEAPGVDRTTGFGIVMPGPALQAVGATPQPFLSAGTAVYTQLVGDGDSVIEPNETWSISLPLTNSGAAAAASINATLSTTSPGVTILAANSSYPNLAAGASAPNATAFQFRVETSFPCGSPISFSEGLTYIGSNSPQTVPFSTGTGSVGLVTQSFSYSGGPVAIPDQGAAVNAPVTVSGVPAAIGDVNVKIDGASCSTTPASTTVGIDHTYVGDLAISLVAPDGTAIPVITNAGAAGANFCQTALDDQSTGPSIQSVTAAQAPFTGSFKPSGALSALNGKNANGVWSLRAQDSGPADIGSIRAFTIGVTPVVCDAPVQTLPTLSISSFKIAEGNAGTQTASFKVVLSAASSSTVSVNFATANGTATAGSDYVAASGNVKIKPGKLSQSVKITINGDTTIEPNETLFGNLSNPVGATIAVGQGVGSIRNDD